jgi:hypothetical protein
MRTQTAEALRDGTAGDDQLIRLLGPRNLAHGLCGIAARNDDSRFDS